MRPFFQRAWMAALVLLLQAGCATSKPAGAGLQLPLLDGSTATFFKGGTNLTVLLFVAVECPVSNRLTPEYSRLAADYLPKGVAFHLVYSGEEAAPNLVRKHGQDYALKIPAVLDGKFELAKKLSARWTPEAFLCTDDGRVLYHGRVNNLFQDYGKMRPEPTIHDLRLALDETLSGKPVSQPFVRPIGCHLPGFTAP